MQDDIPNEIDKTIRNMRGLSSEAAAAVDRLIATGAVTAPVLPTGQTADELISQFAPDTELSYLPELGSGSDAQKLATLVMILSDKVAVLANALAEARSEASDVEEADTVSDEVVNRQLQKYRNVIRTQDIFGLKRGYNLHAFPDIPPYLRQGVAELLLDRCSDLGASPLPMWSSIASNAHYVF